MLWPDDDRQRYLHILEAAGMAQAAGELLDVSALAEELDVAETAALMDLDQLMVNGLCLHGLDEGQPPILLTAGRQFLSRRGDVDREITRFLPNVIDDLNAREALLTAGTILVDEFRAAWLDGDPVEHARELVPPAFSTALDERLALDLYAAAVALMARLSNGVPAGCVAEEIIVVALMNEARVWLDMKCDERLLDEAAAKAAAGELRGLFELFEDDEVLNMFEMSEPADAALAEHDPINQQLGVVDQRIESWFDPFGGTAPTGYLSDPLSQNTHEDDPGQ